MYATVSVFHEGTGIGVRGDDVGKASERVQLVADGFYLALTLPEAEALHATLGSWLEERERASKTYPATLRTCGACLVTHSPGTCHNPGT